MTRIRGTFTRLREAGRTALMPYLPMGYPEQKSALDLIPAIADAGADLVELGIPFSDPLADGPTIQAAAQRALQNRMTLDLCLRQAALLRADGVTTPFVMMSYYNPIFQLGIEAFADRAADAGVDGLIVPDLPPEESTPLKQALGDHGVDLIFLLAPTSDQRRIETVVEAASGFIYLVSLVGVTGARDQIAADLSNFVQRVRAVTDIPLAVGFGISTPEQAAQVGRLADGVIVGSALVKTIGDVGNPSTMARTFVGSLRRGLDRAASEATVSIQPLSSG